MKFFGGNRPGSVTCKWQIVVTLCQLQFEDKKILYLKRGLENRLNVMLNFQNK